MADQEFDTGDVVKHGPSGETWTVAYAEDGRLCPCGWPESLAYIADCTLVKKATQEERDDLLRQLAKHNGSDSRASYARRRLAPPPPPPTGVELIAVERKRQIDKEGWNAQHDDAHNQGELCDAAAAYCMYPREYGFMDSNGDLKPTWPWEPSWFKPSDSDRIPNLVKAGALIAAEIDRLQRLKAAAAAGPEVPSHG